MSGFADLDDLLGPSAPSDSARRDPAVPPSVGSAAPAGGGGPRMEGAYDGAKRFDRSLALWAPPLQSADGEILPDKPMADARVRDTLRNDAYVAGGATIHKDSIVGSVFLLNSKPETKVLYGKEDDVWEREYQEEIETKFTLAAESPRHWLDAAETKTLTAFVRLAVGVDTAGGEVLMTGEWLRDAGRPFKTAVQMIDADRLSTPWNLMSEPSIRGGVERNRHGAPQAYHIRTGHPSDFLTAESYLWKRVPARKPWGRQMILHVFEQMRADQSRGISAMVSALSEMHMTKHFRKVELQRAVVASTYSASIESDMPPDAAFAAMGEDSLGENVTNYAAQWLSALAEYVGGGKGLKIDGVSIPHFFPGTRLKLQNPGNTGPLGDTFEASLLRYIAANLGVSYEQLSRDYSATNYSSARAAMGETWKHMLARKKRVADTTASFIFRLWLEEAINQNQIEALKRRNVPNFYEGLNADAYAAAEWIGAGRGMLDPLKETQAAVLQLKYRLATREQTIAQLNGGDWRRVARQSKREVDLDDNLGLPPLIADGQMEKALSGSPQERTGDA